MSEYPPDKKNIPLTAIPIKRETLRKARLELQDLPVAELQPKNMPLASFPQNSPKVEIEPKSIAPSKLPDEVTPSFTPNATSNTAPHAAPSATSSRTPAFIQPPAQKGSTLNRKALESTNRGVRPSSRRFVRGILHPSPFQVVAAGFFAILVRFALVGVVILGALILLDKVDLRLAWGLLILPVAALFHFATVGKARCRVCGVKEFVPSGSNKHVKTHRFLLMGPIVSTALHLMIFKWFHCMFCGTAIRIKK